MSQVAAVEQVQEGPESPKDRALAPIVVVVEEEPSCGQEEQTPTPRYAPLSPPLAPVQTESSPPPPGKKNKRHERADDARDWQEEAHFRREEEEDAEVFDKEESPSPPPSKKQSTATDTIQ